MLIALPLKTIRIALLLIPFGVSSTYAIPPPPPPPPPVDISNQGVERWDKDLLERQWTADKNVEITRPTQIVLSADRHIRGISFSTPDSYSHINLSGKKLIIGEGGIISNSPRDGGIEKGYLTSSVGMINLVNKADSHPNRPSLFGIGATITDNGKIKVGITISRDPSWEGHRGFTLRGNRSNSFTGDLTIVGNEKLNLEKTDGAIAVSGNFNIIDGAQVRILYSEQIANTSRVSLISKNNGHVSELSFNFTNLPEPSIIKESIREIYVEGKGSIDFFQPKTRPKISIPETYITELYLEDIIIAEGSTLFIHNWDEAHSHFLVRKTSEHLDDALRKIDFIGYDKRTIGKRDYNKDYWEIFAVLPEPSTYGALVAAIGVGTTLALKRNSTRGRTAPDCLCESLIE